MHLTCACLAHHVYYLDGCGASHTRVIHQDNAFTIDLRPIDVVLAFYTKVTGFVGGLNKGTTHVVISNNTVFEGHVDGGSISKGCRNARIRDWYDYIAGYVTFPGEFFPDALTDLINARPFADAVRPGKVNKFENTESGIG